MRGQIPKFVCALFVCIWAATLTAAQQFTGTAPRTGTIIGTVLDGSGDTVRGASVVLQGPTAVDDRRLLTQDNGFFKLDGVKPGTPYHVVVSAKGFAKWTSNNLVLEPGQFFILRGITLRIATAEVTVNVVPPEQIAIEQVKA